MESINQSGNIIVILLVTVKSLRILWSDLIFKIIYKMRAAPFLHTNKVTEQVMQCVLSLKSE